MRKRGAGVNLIEERAAQGEDDGKDEGAILRGPPSREATDGERRVGGKGVIDVSAARNVVRGRDRGDHRRGDRGPCRVDVALARPAVDHAEEEREERNTAAPAAASAARAPPSGPNGIAHTTCISTPSG